MPSADALHPDVCWLSPQGEAALLRRLHLSPQQLRRRFPASLTDPSQPHGPIHTLAVDLLARLRLGALPCFVHACPLWHSAAVSRFPSADALFLLPRSVSGVVVCGCAARCAQWQAVGVPTYTLAQAAALVGTCPAPSQPVSHVAASPCPPGWLEAVLGCAHRLAHGADVTISLSPAEVYGVEKAVVQLQGYTLRVARVRCPHVASQLLQQAVQGSCPYHVMEVLSCASGCGIG